MPCHGSLSFPFLPMDCLPVAIAGCLVVMGAGVLANCVACPDARSTGCPSATTVRIGSSLPILKGADVTTDYLGLDFGLSVLCAPGLILSPDFLDLISLHGIQNGRSSSDISSSVGSDCFSSWCFLNGSGSLPHWLYKLFGRIG
ncbi:hypothetical protein R1flu_012526 [Riccia fluitans]|uniref:Uncharacterized protein n=1 Tax=Riccia fluitans TaxID=41844 RepID=A0ABD1ZAU8_9MARC